MEQSRIYTIKLMPFGGKESDELVRVNSIGFAANTTMSTAAKMAGCDYGELHHQLSRRGGMVHVIRRNGRHWYT
jgi:hypothetical protein